MTLIDVEPLLEIVGRMSTAWEYGQAVQDIYNIIKDQPIVEAIPVSWLDSKQCGAPTEYCTAAWRVMNMWKQKQ